MHAHTDSSLLLQKWSKSAHDKWAKVRIVALVTKQKQIKTRFGILGWNPWGNFRDFRRFFLCECAPWPLTYIAGFI